jgi:hypothetical protein
VQTTPDGEIHMRIALDRRQLLGFENSRTANVVPENAAKVGTKGTIVPSASHDELTRALAAPLSRTLTFPS